MRIVFVNRYFYPDHSATSQLLSDLAFKCAEWGFKVTVVASRQRYDEPSVYLPESETVGGVRIERVSTTHFGRSGPARILDYVSFIRAVRGKLKELVGEGTVVVAKTDPPMLGMFVASVVRARNGVLVNWLQDLFPETLAAVSGSRVVHEITAPLRWLRDRNLGQAAVNVVIGDGMRDHVMASGAPGSKVRVIHNWPFEDGEEKVATDRDFRREWRLSGRFVVGYFGNLGRVHEYETVLGAMRQLESDTDIRFLFVGGGYLLEKLKAEVAALGLSNFVYRDYVPREDLAAALQAADVHLVILRSGLERFVVPSKFAGVVAARKPVLYVGDPQGELGIAVRESECGYVVSPGKDTELAGRIRTLFRDPHTVSVMAERSGAVYQERYRSTALLGQWRALLDEVMESVGR